MLSKREINIVWLKRDLQNEQKLGEPTWANFN